MSYKLVRRCRACGFGAPVGPGGIKSRESQETLIEVFKLAPQPLSNDFKREDESHEGFYPLSVLYCPRCKLGQLSIVVDPVTLYRNGYAYVTSTSRTMDDHFCKIEKELRNRCGKADSIVEIGSNDGRLLDYFKKQGWKTVLGIDPAENLAAVAIAKGIPTLSQFFDESNALTAKRTIGRNPDLILARHCFCHVEWAPFIRALENLAGEETVIAIEVPWAQHMLEKVEFDCVYFEHTSYLSIKSIEFLLRYSNLELVDVLEYDIHGGAIMLILKDRKRAKEARSILKLEQETIDLAMWRRFAERAEINIMELGAVVRNLVSQGKKVVGYGASAKSTVWIQACGFSRKEIAWLSDTTPGKWYTLSPGSDIPIVDSGALTRELPDVAICFAWNFFSEIYEKEAIFRQKGGKWIKPVPKIEVV